MPLAIRADGLVKHFGPTVALDGLDLAAEQGRVLGVLGPNGAGKTTVVRILATLLVPDRGTAEVAGFDVLRQPQHVRSVIGLTGQYAAVDEHLTGFENLDMIGRLAQLGKGLSRQRADELLERFDLSFAGTRPAKTYSGGMRRRLDLAASLVGRPAVLFLDEPTTGLDPQSRNALFEVVRDLVTDGTTILLTTQYLEEADQLADDIAVVDGGRVIAQGTPTELKDSVGGEVLAMRLADAGQVAAALDALGPLGSDARVEGATISLPVGPDKGVLTATGRRLDEAGIGLADLGTRRPSLDDVFLRLTGHTAEGGEDGDAPEAPPRRRRSRKEAA
jgi:daunorubicin resistance ABC transporter ATP-binding subunit